MISFTKQSTYRKSPNSRYIEKLGHKNPSQKSLVSMSPPHIVIESFIHYIYIYIYDDALSPYSSIMDCYRFFSI
jgi:hypothetical protein